ncbi:helix-turn-helix domain-containing protein [Streptosporangium sp. NPDC000239]|uniref:arsenate reductase/protein-tyrosine-phosphatase family protein n=1 Tax=unclassified Streptosporangium TaxID=2632669 RepID=UPI00331A4874
MDIEGRVSPERLALHQALADPARLAIIDALAVGDLSPGELGHALDLPSNLLSHHLRVLTQVGLITRGRSHADRRRVYIRLIPSALEALNQRRVVTAPRVVFVCTRNAARSPLAAALWTSRSAVPVTSAGTQPGPRLNPRAIDTARRHGLSLERHGTADVRDVLTPHDLVVAVCDNAYEHLAPGLRQVHWSIPDPGPVDTDEIFEDVLALLAERVDRLATLTGPTTAPGPP